MFVGFMYEYVFSQENEDLKYLEQGLLKCFKQRNGQFVELTGERS